jgi:SAM-dependent methyltransferase
MRAQESGNAPADGAESDAARRSAPPARDIRGRVYESYVHSRTTPLAPDAVDGFASRAPYLRRLIRTHFPADRAAAVLDLGCGHGTLLYLARQAGYLKVSGVDVSADQVAEARRLGIEGVSQGDLMETLAALPADSQDLIVAFDVIEHFSRDELLPLVDGVRRVLKPGGTWLIHTPNAESPFFGRIRYGDITHEQAFTSTSIRQLLLSSGFSAVRCFEDEPVVHGAMSAVRYVAWKGIRALLRLYLAAETGTARAALFSQNFLAVAVK